MLKILKSIKNKSKLLRQSKKNREDYEQNKTI